MAGVDRFQNRILLCEHLQKLINATLRCPNGFFRAHSLRRYNVTLEGSLTFVPEDITLGEMDQVAWVNLIVPEPAGGWVLGENT